MSSRLLIAVVDDDVSVRESLPDLLRELGFDAEAFPSADHFLKHANLRQTDCLIVDIAMPGMSGPELWRELKARGLETPIIFITGYSIEKIKLRMEPIGAMNYLLKPFSDTSLLAAINEAMKR